jgi:phosphinothricin acetyltransferase
MKTDAPVIACTERHLPAIRDILNEAILNTTALWDEEPRALEGIAQWFEHRKSGGFPVLGIEAADGTLAGYATYGTFRTQCGYRFTVALMHALIDTARAGEIHTLVGVIDAANEGSIRFHRAFGFVPCGTIREAGRKFGRWLDLEFYQLILRPSAESHPPP